MKFDRPRGYQGYHAELKLAAQARQAAKEAERAKKRERVERRRQAKLEAKREEQRKRKEERKRLRRLRRIEYMHERLRIRRLENPELWGQTRFTSPIFEPDAYLRTYYEDNYLDYCIYAAPLLYEMTKEVRLFAELFVAIEVQIGTWAGFLWFGVIDDAQFCALTRTHPHQAHIMRRRTLKYMELIWDVGFPIMRERAARRAYYRYRAICRRMGVPWSRDDRKQETGLVRLGTLVRAHPGVAARFSDAGTFVQRVEQRGLYLGDRGQPRNRACPSAPGGHGHRPCILCATANSTKTLRDGTQRDWFGFTEASSRRGRLTRCCRYLLSNGPGQCQGALVHWFEADRKREFDQSHEAGRRVTEREADLGRGYVERQQQRHRFGSW